MIKQHFGPGNHIHFLTSSRKGGSHCEDDFDDDDEEEGLDEREPEKAICPDNQKMIYKALTSQLA
jgi:alpha-acetolactate decarboxylase